MPDSIIDWVEILTVESVFAVFVFAPATVLLTVAVILTLCPEKFAPKSKVAVLPVGEPPNVKIASLSWLLPVVFKVSPTAPVLPAPVVIIDIAKSSSSWAVKISFVPAVIDKSPFDDNVPVNCRLTVKLVSVKFELLAVNNVLTVVKGNLNNAILLSGFCNLLLCLVALAAVDTSEPPTLAVNSNSLLDIILCTKPVVDVFASSNQVTWSPSLNSVKNFVPLPYRVASPLAIETLPVNCVLSP